MTASIQRGSTETSISVNQLPATPTPAAQVASSSYSRFVQRLRRRYAAELSLLPPGAPRRDSMTVAYEALRQRGDSVGDALRIVRQLVMERLVTLDCDAQAPLAVVTTAVTELAELALDIACQDACHELDAVHGAPLGPEGQRSQLWVVGMGKLGARELNVSSDIDLIYRLRPVDGDTQGDAVGRGKLSEPGILRQAP
jgi:glutamate-ammonia-ligase adenylyltransferase